MKKICLFVCVFVLKSISGYSYGELGHELVGVVAKSYTNKAAVDSVNKYFAGLGWGKAAVWMDEVRSDHFYEYLRPMHYINVEKDSTYVRTKEPNIINELEEAIDKLEHHRKELSKEKIQEYLKIIFHLLGDLHQPLHVGYGDDIGGNSVYVSFMGTETNLHHVWDTDLIEYNKDIKKDIIEMSKKLTWAEIKANQKVDPEAWMNDSRSYLPQVYDFQKDKITKEYADKNVVIIEKLILRGAIRLSGILNQIFAN